MRAMFEKISNELAELLKKDKTQHFDTGGYVQGVDNSSLGNDIGNSVGNFFNGTYYDPTQTSGPSDQQIADTPVKENNGFLSKIGKSVGNSFKSDGVNTDRLWGYSSPVMIAERYLQAGKFFNPNLEPGNKYTDRYATPPKPQPIKAQETSDFYNKWYERMRQFAQAEEVAGNGKATTRSR